MARAYSDDLRRKFLEAHERGEGSLAQLAKRFGVSEGWAEKISAARRRTGMTERPAGGKRGRKESHNRRDDGVSTVACESAAASDAGRTAGGSASQKKSLRAAEQDRERVQAQRRFWQEQARYIDPSRLVFIDESGITTEMTRRYGRALHGARVDEGVPAGHWRTMTVLGAVSVSGWVAVMSVEAATDGDVFLAYLEHVLCPQLRPGQLVVMDNLGAHPEGPRRCIC